MVKVLCRVLTVIGSIQNAIAIGLFVAYFNGIDGIGLNLGVPVKEGIIISSGSSVAGVSTLKYGFVFLILGTTFYLLSKLIWFKWIR